MRRDPAVADGDGQVSSQARNASAFHRAPLQQRPQLIVAPLPQIEERGAVEAGARQPGVVRGNARRRRQVPGANVLADVAAVDVISDVAPRRLWNRSLELDRQIRETPGRVHHVRFDQRAGRAGVETARARPALVERRLIRRQRQAGDQHRQEHPRSELVVDDARVLADPANPGVLRIDALLDGSGVDVGASLEVAAGARAQPREQRLQPLFDDDVIVVAPGVAGNRRPARLARLVRVRPLDVVDGAEDNHRLRGGQDRPDIRPAIGGSMQVLHLTRIAAVQPVAQEPQLRVRRDGRDTAEVEPDRRRLTLDLRR